MERLHKSCTYGILETYLFRVARPEVVPGKLLPAPQVVMILLPVFPFHSILPLCCD